jgi:hypothetical protein
MALFLGLQVLGQTSAYAAAKLMLADDGYLKPTAYDKVTDVHFVN